MAREQHRHDISDSAWKKIRRWTIKKGLNSKIHLAVDAYGMPVRFFIASSTTADRTIAVWLVDGFRAEYLFPDRGYDTDAILHKAIKEGTIPVIPTRKSRKYQREYDGYLYKLRHLV